MGEISAALREQSTAANDIARNVEQIAQMAEQNSSQVDDSVHAAGSLLDLAGQLQRQVANYRV